MLYCFQCLVERLPQATGNEAQHQYDGRAQYDGDEGKLYHDAVQDVFFEVEARYRLPYLYGFDDVDHVFSIETFGQPVKQRGGQ